MTKLMPTELHLSENAYGAFSPGGNPGGKVIAKTQSAWRRLPLSEASSTGKFSRLNVVVLLRLWIPRIR